MTLKERDLGKSEGLQHASAWCHGSLGFLERNFLKESKISNKSVIGDLRGFCWAEARSGNITQHSIEREQLFHLAGELELSNQRQSEGQGKIMVRLRADHGTRGGRCILFWFFS